MNPRSSFLDPQDLLWSGILFVAAAVTYLSFLTQSFVFEGLARAMPIETGRFAKLFNGNYLIYGFLGNGFHLFLHRLGFNTVSVVSLQIMDSFIGAAGVFIFFHIARLLGAGRFSAFVWSAVLGACLGYWSWSTDAQNYIFSTLMLEINFLLFVAFAAGRRIHPAVLGAFQALAVFGHIVNVLFGLVGAAFIVMTCGRAWRKAVLQYALTSLALVLLIYASVLAFIVRPANFAILRLWFMGSLATADGKVGWHGHLYSWESFWLWLKMTLNIFVSRAPAFGRPPAWRFAGALLWAARAVLAFFAARLLFFANRLEGARRTVAIGCCVWLAAYALVFSSWEPGTMVYRVSDLVPFVTLLFLGAQAGGTGLAASAAAALFAILLGAGNFAAEIYPRSFVSNSPQLSRMALIKTHTADGDWVLGDQGDELYVAYFAERRPILLGRYQREPEVFKIYLTELLASGQAVYLTSRVLEEPFWRNYFTGSRLVLKARDESGFTLYRLTALAAR